MSHPQDFNTFKIYSKVAEDLQNANPVISYYLKTYTLNKALEYLKNERSQGKDVSDRTQEIKVWLQDLENLKGRLDNQLSDKEHCKQLFKDFTQNLFQKSDYDYRTANYSRTLARDFLYVSVLFDAWELLGAQNEETKEKKNYSNQARFKIMETLANGTKPVPIPQPNVNNTQPVINQNQAQPTQPVNQEKKEPENLVKHDGPVDLLAKINFALTESIVVPQTSIDKFLNTNAKKPEAQPPTDTHLNPNQLNPNVTNQWGIRIGKSMTIDENAPGPNQQVPHYDPYEDSIPHHDHDQHQQIPHHDQHQQIPHYDPYLHPPPITRQKTPPTVFYAPRHHPNLHVNNPQTEVKIESREDNLKHYVLETPGGPDSEDHHPEPKVETPEENVKHYVLETPGGPDFEDQPEPKIESHGENSQNLSKVSQKIPEPHQNLPHEENLPNISRVSQKIPESHSHGHNSQDLSMISEGPSHSESMSKLEVIPENPTSVSQHLSSILHESQIPSHQGDNIETPAILENAQPAESIIPSDHQEPQSQNLESIKLDVQNTSVVQEQSQVKPENPSIHNESQVPSNTQSVFNQSTIAESSAATGQSKNLDAVKNLEHENLDPNPQSQVHDSTFSRNDTVLKCKGVKDICLKAIIDLNTTNVKEARQKLQQALQILSEME